MQTRASKQRLAELERHHAERYERIGKQTPPPSLHRAVMGGGVKPVAAKPKLTKAHKVKQSIRDSAMGEECTVRLPGVCNHNPETTVWSHYPGNEAGNGMGTKSLDLAGCYCCSDCHDVVDRRVRGPMHLTRDEIMVAWFEGHMRSLVRLAEKGLL